MQLTLATGLMEKARKFAVKTDDVTALCKELNAVYGWLQKADAALRGQPKLDLNEFKKVMEDGEKLKVDQTLLKRMKTQIKNAKAWRAKVKKTGLEKGEATVAELRELLPEAKNIMIDLSDELDVIQAATSKFCICRQVSACVLGRHGVQRVGFASTFRPRAAAAAASAAALLPPLSAAAAPAAAAAAPAAAAATTAPVAVAVATPRPRPPQPFPSPSLQSRGGDMIECQACGEKYHKGCLGIHANARVENYSCLRCLTKQIYTSVTRDLFGTLERWSQPQQVGGGGCWCCCTHALISPSRGS